MREGSWPGPGQLGAMGEGSEDARQAGREAAAGGISIRPARPPRSEQLVPTRALPRAWVRDGGAGQRSTKSGLRPPAPVLRRCPSAPLAHGYPPHGSPTLHPGTSAAVGCGPRTAALALRPSHAVRPIPRRRPGGLHRVRRCRPTSLSHPQTRTQARTHLAVATVKPSSLRLPCGPSSRRFSPATACPPRRRRTPQGRVTSRRGVSRPSATCHVPQRRVTSLSGVSRPSAACHIPQRRVTSLRGVSGPSAAEHVAQSVERPPSYPALVRHPHPPSHPPPTPPSVCKNAIGGAGGAEHRRGAGMPLRRTAAPP